MPGWVCGTVSTCPGWPGVRAAKSAGIFCVAVPNEVTRDLGLDEAGADLILDSLADLPPDELLTRFAEE